METKQEIKQETEKPQPQPTAKEPSELVREARERLKIENDALEAEKFRAEKLRSEAILGGGSPAGSVGQPKEESPKDYVKRVMSGKL